MEIKIGTVVKADHPITVLNPTETFVVAKMRYEQSRNVCFVAGEQTCWFRADQVEIVRPHQKAVSLIELSSEECEELADHLEEEFKRLK